MQTSGLLFLVAISVGCAGAPGSTNDPGETGDSGGNGSNGDGSGSDSGSGSGSGSGGTSTDPERLYGVTVDDVAPLQQIVVSLQNLPRRATTRIVFDEGQPPSAYATAVPAIAAVSDVMGELLDSWYVPSVSVQEYLTRTEDYLAAFGGQVAIWEVGNEINGEWVDDNAGGVGDVVAKMAGAFDLVRAAGGKTALTLYGCSDTDNRYDMLVWAEANVPARMRTGLDYVLVSFYEGDCGVPPPDWNEKFHALRQLFPTAALGFGEVGAVDTNGNRIANTAVAGPYLERYYTMQITEPGYIGGYFWWYYVQDMLPYPSTMHMRLSSAIQ